MSELLIRPSHNDHLIIADLLSPAGAALLQTVRRPISRLVLDAPLAASERQYRDAAADSGTAVLIDPLTPLVQAPVDPQVSWAKLPFAQADALADDLISNAFFLNRLVEQTVSFQIEHGASAVVAPYFYCQSAEDPAFAASLELLRLTARYLRLNHSGMPLVAVLCGTHAGFARLPTFRNGIDAFAAAALDLGPQTLALCLSPNGAGDEGEAKVLQLFTAAQRLKASGASVIAWRQGFYGPALVAAGLDGYETGIGVQERTNMASYATTRKPGCRDRDRAASPTPVYFEVLGRSVLSPVAACLFESRALKAELVCRDVRCCAHGAETMLGAGRRPHAVRTRARTMRELEQMPHGAWRLQQTSKDAYAASLTARRANEALSSAGLSAKIPTKGYESLGKICDLLGRNATAHAA
ncbi:MAG: hypothetical protein WKF96_08810 [Solirubrobacteraceae bacterium]